MNVPNLFAVSFAFLAAAGLLSAQADPQKHPEATFGNETHKPLKPSQQRTILGTVKDQADNPVSGAIVQLKDLRTQKVIDFATKDDGKFVFRELRLDVNYELVAKRGELVAPTKKVTIYDTRNQVLLTFKLAPPDPTAAAKPQ
ncbi:MAG TPA: carboxypeptidase-like regulatory domain-containing protein [Bryobacteraceae bacterium]|nr:carboxypeptidase-like regulatory domain-containing protein [Bryobacteraceae bacterium]